MVRHRGPLKHTVVGPSSRCARRSASQMAVILLEEMLEERPSRRVNGGSLSLLCHGVDNFDNRLAIGGGALAFQTLLYLPADAIAFQGLP